MVWYQHPMTQAAEEDRRKKDLPCDRLQSEMITEGLMDEWGEGCHWTHIAIGVAVLALLVGAILYYYRGRHTGGDEEMSTTGTLAPSESPLYTKTQTVITAPAVKATPAPAATPIAIENAASSFGDTTTASYFF